MANPKMDMQSPYLCSGQASSHPLRQHTAFPCAYMWLTSHCTCRGSILTVHICQGSAIRMQDNLTLS